MAFAAHNPGDALAALAKRRTDNEAALAAYHHGLSAPSDPPVGELWADSAGENAMRMRSPEDEWVNLWALDGAPGVARYATGAFVHGQNVVVGFRPTAVTLQIEVLANRFQIARSVFTATFFSRFPVSPGRGDRHWRKFLASHLGMHGANVQFVATGVIVLEFNPTGFRVVIGDDTEAMADGGDRVGPYLVLGGDYEAWRD